MGAHINTNKSKIPIILKHKAINLLVYICTELRRFFFHFIIMKTSPCKWMQPSPNTQRLDQTKNSKLTLNNHRYTVHK